jgi:hypothetical protein
MAAIDKLSRRLVLAARAADALERALEVGEILEKFLPYKLARRDGLLETNDDYLHAVMRLVSGERALLFADDLMQDDLTNELKGKNPDLGLLRTYRNVKVRLSTQAVERVLAGDTEIDLRPSTPTPVMAAPVVTEADHPPTAPHLTEEAAALVATVFEAEAPNHRTADGCPYCNGPLPHDRTLRFCPSCGLDLLLKRCAGCSAEIESGWKYCVTCGRTAA